MPPSNSHSAASRAPASAKFIIALFLIAASVRLLPVLLTPNLGIGLDDMFQYDMLARSLAAGDGFRWYQPADLERMLQALRQVQGVNLEELEAISAPLGLRTSFRAPLYPGFLSLIYLVVDSADRLLAARLVQALLLASLAPLTYGIARQLDVRPRLAFAAGLMPALWPLLVSLPLALATENLFLPLVAAGTLLLLRSERNPSQRNPLAAGVIFGLAALTRSVIIGFPFLAAGRAWLMGRRRQALLLILPVVLLVTPWVIRNSLLHGHLTMVETSLGYNLYLGYHPDNTGTFKFGPSIDLITIVDDYERDQVGRRLAWQFIKADPGRIPQLMLWKLAHFWGLEDRAFSFLYSNSLLGRWPPALVLSALVLTSLPLVIMLPLALAGWALSVRDREWQLLSLLFAWYIGVHLLIMAEERFHFVLLPMLAALAMRGVQNWPSYRQKWARGEASTRRRVLLALLLIGLLWLNWGFEINRNFDRYQVLMQPEGWRSHFDY